MASYLRKGPVSRGWAYGPSGVVLPRAIDVQSAAVHHTGYGHIVAGIRGERVAHLTAFGRICTENRRVVRARG